MTQWTFDLGETLDLESVSFRRDEAAAKVALIRVEQFRIPLRPCAGVQVARKFSQPLRYVVYRPEGRHGCPNSGIEIGRRPPPIGAQETVSTVMRNWNGRNLY